MFGRERIGDRSWIGTPMKYLGILNGCIYVTPQEPEFWNDEERMVSLPLDIWSEGWDHYQDPKILLEDVEIELTTDQIQTQIDLAIADENFELAERLTKKLNKK